MQVFAVTFLCEVIVSLRVGADHFMLFMTADTCLPTARLYSASAAGLGTHKVSSTYSQLSDCFIERSMNSEWTGKGVQWKGLWSSLKHYPDFWGEKYIKSENESLQTGPGHSSRYGDWDTGQMDRNSNPGRYKTFSPFQKVDAASGAHTVGTVALCRG